MTAVLLTVCGLPPTEAIRLVRQARPGTIETQEQEKFIKPFKNE